MRALHGFAICQASVGEGLKGFKEFKRLLKGSKGFWGGLGFRVRVQGLGFRRASPFQDCPRWRCASGRARPAQGLGLLEVGFRDWGLGIGD